MLCDPVPGPNHKREILHSFASGEGSQIVNDLVWLAFMAGRTSRIDYPGVIFEKAFVKWLSDESGIPESQIVTYFTTTSKEKIYTCKQVQHKSAFVKLKDFVNRSLRS